MWNWLFFSVWGGRNLCGKMRGMRFWKTLEFWWSFFHFQGPNTSELSFFFGTDMMNHCSILRSEFRRGNRVPTSFNLCRLLLMLGFQSPAAPWKSIVRTELLLDVVLGLGDMAILLISEIWWAPVEFGSLSYYFQGFSTIPSGSPDFFHQPYDESMGVIQGSRSYCYDLKHYTVSDQPTPPPRSKGQGSIRAY